MQPPEPAAPSSHRPGFDPRLDLDHPGLQFAPIRHALPPTDRKLGVVLTAVSYALILVVGPILVGNFRTLRAKPWRMWQQTAQLQLAEEAPPEPERPRGSAGTKASAATRAPSGSQGATRPGQQAVPQDLAAFELEAWPTRDDLPTLLELSPGTASTNGTGRDGAAGRGRVGGKGQGSGGGHNIGWVHLAHGTEEIQLTGNSLDYQSFIPPSYPEAARIDHIAGDVIIRVTIDEAGRPIKWRVLEGHALLVAASVQVLPKWQFFPISYLGKKVRATVDVTLRFTLI